MDSRDLAGEQRTSRAGGPRPLTGALEYGTLWNSIFTCEVINAFHIQRRDIENARLFPHASIAAPRRAVGPALRRSRFECSLQLYPETGPT